MGVCLLAFCTGVLAVGIWGLNLGTEALRTLAFVVLVFGSQATIYAIRERRHLWGARPSLLLAVSSVADIAIASTLAVGGIAMAPLPALLVAGTLAAAVIFAFILDLVKVPVFARLGIAKSQRHGPTTHVIQGIAATNGIPMTEPSARSPKDSEKPEAKSVEANAEAKPRATAETPADLTPRIAKRAYKLYEEGGHKDGAAVQDWQKAESEIRQELPKAERARGPKAEPDTVAKVPQAESQAETPTDATPQLVKRVHALYEELGRQDVQTVLDWEQAKGKIRNE